MGRSLRLSVALALVWAIACVGTPPVAADVEPPPDPGAHVLPAPPDIDSESISPAPPGDGGQDLGGRPRAEGRLVAAGDVACAGTTSVAVRNGSPIVVKLPPAPSFVVGTLGARYWSSPPVTDPTWQLWLYSFRWMQPLVRRAVEDEQGDAREVLLAQLARFYAEHPDPGRAIQGWDEGASLRRLESLNCIYKMTQDNRLPAFMATEVRLLFGPRYYGPPRYPVHNHGLMANLRIIQAGTLLGRTDWVNRASGRIRSESGMAFSPRGTSWEQSAMYQWVNTDLWGQAAAALRSSVPSTAAAIDRIVRRATDVSAWVTEPDGDFVQIGDSEKVRGLVAADRTDPGYLRDDRAGLIVGRWSWSDPETSYYTLRYGPPRVAHGHPDQGGVTWTTRGTRVLVGSGFFGYHSSSPFVRYQQTRQAANVAVPAAGRLARRNASLTRALPVATRHRWTVSDTLYGRPHARYVDVAHSSATLTVSDVFRGRGAADQYWHLDPAWRLLRAPRGGTSMSFAGPEGRVLTIRTTGRLLAASRGRIEPVAGWQFPKAGQRVANWQLQVRGATGTIRTTFTVR